MKREIKFRGKRIDNGQWVYGYYCGGDYPCIMDISRVDYGSVDVDPETVGQFTGNYDENKVPIYEDDIVKYDYNWDYEDVECTRRKFKKETKRHKISRGKVYWDNADNEYGNYCISPHRINLLPRTCLIHVIGNAFDNPELLN